MTKKKEVYEVYLGPSSRESVQLLNDGRARLFRSGQFITEFVPTPSQIQKIASMQGTIVVTDYAIRRAGFRSRGYFY